jgi:hypothetical protein
MTDSPARDLSGTSTNAQIVGGTEYGADMADADTRIDSLKDDIRVLSYSVLDLQEKASAHDAKLAEILITLDAHGTKLDTHDRRFDQVDARLDGIDGRLDGIDGRLGGIDGRLDSHDRRFDHVDELLAQILSRLPQRPE